VPVHYKTTYRCDWCEAEKEYAGEDFLANVANDGWVVLTLEGQDEERVFCSMDCLLSSL